jgi:hypothetical protein
VKLALIVEVPDDFLERRVRDLNEEFPNERGSCIEGAPGAPA